MQHLVVAEQRVGGGMPEVERLKNRPASPTGREAPSGPRRGDTSAVMLGRPLRLGIVQQRHVASKECEMPAHATLRAFRGRELAQPM